MQINDVVDKMTAGVIAALEKGLTFQEMSMAFKLAAVKEARKRSVNNYRGAMLLHMHHGYFTNLLNGTQAKKSTFRKGGKGGTRRKKETPESQEAAEVKAS